MDPMHIIVNQQVEIVKKIHSDVLNLDKLEHIPDEPM